ncbi:TPA: hypothetical protein ACH3X1_008177 [Trebouxia sp. C0004]
MYWKSGRTSWPSWGGRVLASTTIGLDDDLTILQQQRKNAAWPAFKDCRSRGVKTQWRADKLFVKEGEHFVEHKLLNL